MSDGISNGQSPALEPQWCLVANVREWTRRGVGGQDIERGTKHFSGEQKYTAVCPNGITVFLLWGGIVAAASLCRCSLAQSTSQTGAPS